MAKTITVTDPITEKSYTLEFTRKTVALMEQQGFIAEEIQRKPMTHLPALFAGAFMARHKFVKQEVVDRIYAALRQKDKLIAKLVEMYNDPIAALLDEPEDAEGGEGNPNWTADW